MVGLLAIAGISTARSLRYRDFPASNVTVLSLDKTSNSTGGQANVAIGGVLNPFGSIGAGCGVNWDSGVAYGGMKRFERTDSKHILTEPFVRWYSSRLRRLWSRWRFQDYSHKSGSRCWHRPQSFELECRYNFHGSHERHLRAEICFFEPICLRAVE